MRNIELLKKSIAEVFVVMLARVYESVRNIGALAFFVFDRADDWGNLDEIGARTGDYRDVHSGCFTSETNCLSLPLVVRSSTVLWW